ncbi:MAG: hypothetical protein GY949_20385, partial [Gammaproteobacteria bacterium]|nr:hypothetical protein [Gammaproteobacteria bacterium]
MQNETDLAAFFGDGEDPVAELSQALDAVGCALLANARKAVMKLNQKLHWQSFNIFQATQNVILGTFD